MTIVHITNSPPEKDCGYYGPRPEECKELLKGIFEKYGDKDKDEDKRDVSSDDEKPKMPNPMELFQILKEHKPEECEFSGFDVAKVLICTAGLMKKMILKEGMKNMVGEIFWWIPCSPCFLN